MIFTTKYCVSLSDNINLLFNNKVLQVKGSDPFSRKKGSQPVLLHSDQGSQYRAAAYLQMLKQNNIQQSMSRKGKCLDNAVAESFFGTLKNELVYQTRYKTREEAKSSIFEYIEVFYNRVRRHSYLNYQSPLSFENDFYNSN